MKRICLFLIFFNVNYIAAFQGLRWLVSISLKIWNAYGIARYTCILFRPVKRNQKFDYQCIKVGNKIYYTPLLAIFICYYKHFSIINRQLWRRYWYASINSNVQVWPQISLGTVNQFLFPATLFCGEKYSRRQGSR